MDVPERQYDLHRQREQRHAGTDAYVGPEPVHHYAFTTATQASISRLAGACKCDGTTPSIRLPWHEARPYQAVCEKIGNPHRVVDVALATGNIANVRSIRKHQLEPALQDVPNRLPVDAGGLHRYVRDPLRRQPIRQLQQIPRCR
jgi:hypothetical protein